MGSLHQGTHNDLKPFKKYTENDRNWGMEDCYMYYLGDGSKICRNRPDRKFKPILHLDVLYWKINDTITVCLDCNRWELQFKNNDKSYYKAIKIASNITYHPYIQTTINGSMFQLISTTL